MLVKSRYNVQLLCLEISNEKKNYKVGVKIKLNVKIKQQIKNYRKEIKPALNYIN